MQEQHDIYTSYLNFTQPSIIATSSAPTQTEDQIQIQDHDPNQDQSQDENNQDSTAPIPTTTPTPINPQTLSPLFTLPHEIRQRIYDFLLSFTDSSFIDTLQPFVTYLDTPIASTFPLPALLLTCHLAHLELSPLIRHTATLRIRRGARSERRIGLAGYGVVRLERLRSLTVIVELQHANWNAWLGFLEAALIRMPALEKLLLDWGPMWSEKNANAVAWTIRQDERKEAGFLDAVRGREGLRVVWMYGRVPGHWAEMLRKGGQVTVKCFPERWWKEPGFD